MNKEFTFIFLRVLQKLEMEPKKKDLVYVALAHQKQYVDLLQMLMSSMVTFGSHSSHRQDYDFLIITDSQLEPLTRENPVVKFCNPKIFVVGKVNGLFAACSLRLKIFDYPELGNYNKILYLDTDVLIPKDLSWVFDLDFKQDEIQVFDEGGSLNHPFWGWCFTPSEVAEQKDKGGFTSGVLLFRNRDFMKQLFQKAIQMVEGYEKAGKMPPCFDQPVINYLCYKGGAVRKGFLQKLQIHNPEKPEDVKDKVIAHFPGDPGNHGSKQGKMSSFMRVALPNLGRVSVTPSTSTLSPKVLLVDKKEDMWTISHAFRSDLFRIFSTPTFREWGIAEIGSYKGLTSPLLSELFGRVYAVDNNPAFHEEARKRNSSSTNINYVLMNLYEDSEWKKLPEIGIQVVLIDACHDAKSVSSDLKNSLRHFKDLKYLVFDDYATWPGVREVVDKAVKDGQLCLIEKVGLARDIPYPGGLFSGESEGVVCGVNRVLGCSFSWRSNCQAQDGVIEFGAHGELQTPWGGEGKYTMKSWNSYQLNFGGQVHCVTFDNTFTNFISVRHSDIWISCGELVSTSSPQGQVGGRGLGKIKAGEKEQILVKVAPYTQLGRERLLNNIWAVEHLIESKIEGDFVEVGVWKGGSVASMLLALNRLGTQRTFHLYDTFSGMTSPLSVDLDLTGRLSLREGDNLAPLDECKRVISTVTGYDEKYLEYHVGDIMKCKKFPDKIALLRLDTDFYDSTKHELEHMYPNVVKGGIVIIDDYGHFQGCRKAVDEFLAVHPEVRIEKIDYTGIWFFKP